MYEKGNYVIYGGKGVCEVMDVKTMNIDGIPKDKLYYVLKPYAQKSGMIYAPVDSQKTVMRKIITKEEADALIEDIPNIEDVWVANERQREEHYKECLRTCQCRDLVRVIKTLYRQQKRRVAMGKKPTATDDRYMKQAEDSLYSELSLSLGIPRSDMVQYINSRIQGAAS